MQDDQALAIVDGAGQIISVLEGRRSQRI